MKISFILKSDHKIDLIVQFYSICRVSVGKKKDTSVLPSEGARITLLQLIAMFMGYETLFVCCRSPPLWAFALIGIPITSRG